MVVEDSTDGKPLSARATLLRAGFCVVFAGLAWLSWRWNGPLVGVPVAIGLVLGGIHRCTRLWTRQLSRHPAWDQAINLVFAGAVLLCGESLWGGRMSPGHLDFTAAMWVVWMAPVPWAMERWNARRQRSRTAQDAPEPVDSPS
jgi:hypothetical protein